MKSMGTEPGDVPDLADHGTLQLLELQDRERCFRELFEASPHPLFAEDWSKLKRYVDKLKTRPLLDGKRGKPPSDVASFAKAASATLRV